MAKDYEKPPYHWRAGHGYVPPMIEDKKPVAKPATGGYYASLPFSVGLAVTPAGGYYAPFPFHVGPGPSCYPGGPIPYAYGGLPFSYRSYAQPVITVTPRRKTSTTSLMETSTDDSDASSVSSTSTSTSDSGSDSEDDKPSPTKKCPGEKLLGGLRKGASYLFTGRPCHIHVIDGNQISLRRLLNHDKPAVRFRFTRHVVMDNSTVKELMEALGGDWKKACLTQMWEWGDGKWKGGSGVEIGEKRAKQRLSEMGWSEAGSKGRAPVWLYLKKK